MTWLLKLFTGIKGYLLTALGAVAAISLAYLKGSKSGQDSLKAKQAAKTLKDVKKAHEINENVRTLSPDELDSRLLKYKRKR